MNIRDVRVYARGCVRGCVNVCGVHERVVVCCVLFYFVIESFPRGVHHDHVTPLQPSLHSHRSSIHTLVGVVLGLG